MPTFLHQLLLYSQGGLTASQLVAWLSDVLDQQSVDPSLLLEDLIAAKRQCTIDADVYQRLFAMLYPETEITTVKVAAVDSVTVPSRLRAADQTLAVASSANATPLSPAHYRAKDVALKSAKCQPLAVGRVLKDRFIIEACIGQGGMGTVYKARDLRKEEMQDDASYVAIKCLNDEFSAQEEALISLQREAKKSQALAHPNIVTVYDFDREGDLVFLTMEYLQGETLDKLIASQYCQRLPLEKVMHLIELIARALAYSHQQGFVHADLKPSNIFLTHDGTIKVLDFGIAQAVKLHSDYRFPQDSQFDAYTLGAITPNFASPEMLADQAPRPADDLYSLGCVAYALLTGQHPFVDDQGAKVTAKQAQQRAMAVAAIPHLSRRHMRALRRCLDFDGRRRFQNAGEFIEAIKPPTPLRRWMTVSLVTLLFIAASSWWFTAKQAAMMIGLEDLPTSMSALAETIALGDARFNHHDIDQAHKLYAQAWEASYELDHIDPRDQFKLKVIIDRRIDQVIEYLIAESEKQQHGEFQLLQLQIALEFLKQDDVGTLDREIDQALINIAQKLEVISRRERADAVE